ncbi:hypothetical protein EV187_3448 [Agromyces ramosus]|uniref:Uncharacterized protein n=1 Tax=Agromyces ramosus TaxID=33879 RepID=A0A4Q7MA38_9MICO|nr:hypothetical protein [Agromyces ramosus]RZS63542.1 hypothetical protein EV187_3448 [Agromyces ramosus]
MDASEGRIRALQRLAYGADVTDAERASAIDELGELARAADRDDVRGTADDDRASSRAGSADATDATDATTGSSSAERTLNGDRTGRGRLVRWTIAAGALGLLLGAVLGWGAGRLPGDGAASTTPVASAEPGPPLEETEILEVFDRLPPAAESTQVAAVDDAIDPASVRLLATRVDGPAAYLTRTADGEDVCLVLLMPDGTPRTECTVDGRLPPDGLSILYGAEGYGLSAARLSPTGTVSLGLIAAF